MIELESKLNEGFIALLSLIEINLSDNTEIKNIINGR